MNLETRQQQRCCWQHQFQIKLDIIVMVSNMLNSGIYMASAGCLSIIKGRTHLIKIVIITRKCKHTISQNISVESIWPLL